MNTEELSATLNPYIMFAFYRVLLSCIAYFGL